MSSPREDLFDLAVVGLGGVGSVLLDLASARGARVVGLERHPELERARECSMVSSRGFRQTYASPRYRELAHASLAYWAALNAESPGTIFHPSGATISAPRDHPVLVEIREAARALDAECRAVSNEERARFLPRHHDLFTTLHEPGAGWIDARGALLAMRARASRQGASLLFDHDVLALHVSASGVLVHTRAGNIHARHVILSTAHRMPRVVLADHVLGADEPPKVSCRRQIEHWFSLPSRQAYDLGMFHLVGLHDRVAEGGVLYGIAEREDLLKCCLPRAHGATTAHSPEAFERATSEEVRDVSAALRALFSEDVLRGMAHTRSRVSWNVETSSKEFLLGRVEDLRRVSQARAFCGHGFKMFPALAGALLDEVLA